jgi:hypothetical protein
MQISKHSTQCIDCEFAEAIGLYPYGSHLAVSKDSGIGAAEVWRRCEPGHGPMQT